jgi:multicomponent Na+:H+ antiporter subunit B
MKKALGILMALVCLGATALVTFPIFLDSRPWPDGLRNVYEAKAYLETGAINVVSAIYLGYRAFDTLGEAIVLLIAVSGTLAIIADGIPGSKGLATEFRRQNSPAEDPLELIAGKLGLVVLVFGAYVMAFGHLSPGGGFQGGVVVASGLLFLALGEKGRRTSRLTDPKSLQRLEAGAFLILLLAMAAGMINRKAGNPAEYIVFLNVVLGLKVGAGIGLMCVAMIGDLHR